MTAPGNLKPVKSNLDGFEVEAVCSIGASGAHTILYTTAGAIGSVTRQLAGKFTVVFNCSGGDLIDLEYRVSGAADAETLCASLKVGSYTRTATGSTAQVEVYEIDETKAAVDPASGDRVYIRARFLKNAV